MKNILIATVAFIALLSFANCASFTDTNKVGGKTVVTSTKGTVQVFGILGSADVGECLSDLNSNGVKDVVSVGGHPKGAVSSGPESCQATGTK